MIPVSKPRAPIGFKADVETKGKNWLAANQSARPSDYPAYWRTAKRRKYVILLREAFAGRCAYTAHLIDYGTVDHFYSKENYRARTYLWSNYRFASSWINSAKKPIHDGNVIDPYLVQAGWFEVILPSMQLQANFALIPVPLHSKVIYTLEHLPIRDDERVVTYRQECYELYKANPQMDWLKREAPLVGFAVEKWLAANPGKTPNDLP